MLWAEHRVGFAGWITSPHLIEGPVVIRAPKTKKMPDVAARGKAGDAAI
jgi:hypothetical protein